MTFPIIYYPEDIVKIILAVLVGGLIGAEREFHNKAAGFRTLIFICVGATLFTIISVRIGASRLVGDPGRIAAQIVSGVGFIGAGVIMRGPGRIHGITTAATIWLIAALGTGLGIGEYSLVFTTTAAVLIVLLIFPRLERQIENMHEERAYEVICPAESKQIERVTALFKESGLRLYDQKKSRIGTEVRLSWEASGSPSKHEELVKKLLEDSLIHEFHF